MRKSATTEGKPAWTFCRLLTTASIAGQLRWKYQNSCSMSDGGPGRVAPLLT
jgi:hypothetical protein